MLFHLNKNIASGKIFTHLYHNMIDKKAIIKIVKK